MTQTMSSTAPALPKLVVPAGWTGKSRPQRWIVRVPHAVWRRAAAAVLPVLPVAAFIVLWHLLTAHNVVAWLRFNRMPAPATVLEALLARLSNGTYYDDLAASLQRILLGSAWRR